MSQWDQESSMPTGQTKKHTTPLVELTYRDGILLIKPTGPSIGQREAPIIQEEAKPFLEEAGKDQPDGADKASAEKSETPHATKSDSAGIASTPKKRSQDFYESAAGGLAAQVR